MSRHRAAPPPVGLMVVGAVVGVMGLALLLAPARPVAAQAGSVLDPPASGPSSSTPAPTTAPVTVPGTLGDGASPSDLPPLPGLKVGFVPDRIVIEALDVDAALVTTLTDGDGDFVPPEDPSDLGWWRGVRPGVGAGSVLVAGHIDSSRYGQGPLARLVDLRPGDRAVVTGPDGARAEYAVRGVETFPKESLPASELFGADGPERLVLVTCGGTYDRRLGSWDSNIVAVLDPVPA